MMGAVCNMSCVEVLTDLVLPSIEDCPSETSTYTVPSEMSLFPRQSLEFQEEFGTRHFCLLLPNSCRVCPILAGSPDIADIQSVLLEL